MLGITLHDGWVLTRFWILAIPLLMAVFLVGVVCFVLLVLVARRNGKSLPLVAIVIFAVIGMAGPIVLTSSPKTSAAIRFWVERPIFSAIAEMELPLDEMRPYDGVELPRSLCVVSVNCEVYTLHTFNTGEPVLFVPDYLGIPDGAAGYGHFARTPSPGMAYDGFGDRICPTMELADGWWWLGFCG